MNWLRTAFTKVKDYFTANLGRKIFFFGIIATIFGFVLYTCFHIFLVRTLAVLGLVVAGAGTLWDSMLERYVFLQKVRDLQYAHLKETYDKQAAGEDVVMTPTFSDEEARYVRRRQWGFVFTIIFKAGVVLALFSLLLSI